MTENNLTSGANSLADAARKYFSTLYQSPPMDFNIEVDKSLNWKPTLTVRVSKHKTILVEASETPYPRILSMRRAEIMRLNTLISIYCICPEKAYLGDQQEAKRLTLDGFGLLTVDASGAVHKRSDCIPLIQQIADSEFNSEVKGLPKAIRIRLSESFDRYKHDPLGGLADISEVLEALILKAGRDAIKKGWLTAADVKPGYSAKTLATMQGKTNFQNAAAVIGAAQGYINLYRNLAHHAPKDKKQATKKYTDCRHGFLDGLKKIPVFSNSMKSLGLSGKLSA